jgi:hypothetical protein
LSVLQESSGAMASDAAAPRDLAESVAEAIIRHQDFRDKGKITAVGQLLQLATKLGQSRQFRACNAGGHRFLTFLAISHDGGRATVSLL